MYYSVCAKIIIKPTKIRKYVNWEIICVLVRIDYSKLGCEWLKLFEVTVNTGSSFKVQLSEDTLVKGSLVK